MAKLRNKVSRPGNAKLPDLGSIPRSAIPNDVSGQIVKLTSAGSVVQALAFGSLHTKVKGSTGGSPWGGLLNAATSGGASSFLGGGLLSTGTLGFIGKLLDLFGGSKATPAAPIPFVFPAPQAVSLNVGSPSAVSSISLGVQASVNNGGQSGPIYPQTLSSATDHAMQSSHVVQIVKQALLTSSSLNDVISEI